MMQRSSHLMPAPALIAGAPFLARPARPAGSRRLRRLAGRLVADWYALRTYALRQVWHAHQP